MGLSVQVMEAHFYFTDTQHVKYEEFITYKFKKSKWILKREERREKKMHCKAVSNNIKF